MTETGADVSLSAIEPGTDGIPLPSQFVGFLPRSQALAIDILLVHLIYGCCWLAICLSCLGIGDGHLLSFLPSLLFGSFLAALSFPVFVFVYFVGMHAWQGQTVGKMFMGIRVVSRQGQDVTPGLAFLRCIGYGLSLFPAGLGFFWCIADMEKRAWHDSLAGTRVVVKL